MKIKHFYSHLIQVNDITLDLGELEMSQEERLHLLSLLNANIHSTVINTVLSQLNEKEKKVFLANLLLNDHEKTLKHIRENSKDFEEKISDAVYKLIKEMQEDIKNVKKLGE